LYCNGSSRRLHDHIHGSQFVCLYGHLWRRYELQLQRSAGSTHTVNKADTTTTITSNLPNPTAVGEAVSVHYSVAITPPGAGSLTGNVTVSDGVGDTCSDTVSAGTCDITPTAHRQPAYPDGHLWRGYELQCQYFSGCI